MENLKVEESKTGLKKIFGPITVDNVSPSLNPKKAQAQLRQAVTIIYPGVRANDSLSDALFPSEAFGAKVQEFVEQRVAWIPVPLGATPEMVAEQLAKSPNARLVKHLSLKPILTEEQKNAIAVGISEKTLEDYAGDYVLGDLIDESDPDGPRVPALYLDKHKQYRVIKFRANGGEDVDMRANDLKDIVDVQMTDAQKTETSKA